MAQARQTTTDKKPLASHITRGLKEGALLIFGFTALYFFVALFSYDASDPGWSHSGLAEQKNIANLGGPTGALISDIFLSLFGYLAFLFPVMVAYSGLLIYRDRRNEHTLDKRGVALRSLGFILTLISGCALASMYDGNIVSPLPVNAGGILGDVLGGKMEQGFNIIGATLLLLAIFFAGVTLFTHLSWLWLMDTTGAYTLKGFGLFKQLFVRLYGFYEIRQMKKKRDQQFKVTAQRHEVKRKPPVIKAPPKPLQESKRVQLEKQTSLFVADSDGSLPSISLLDGATPSQHVLSEEALKAISQLVEMKLQDFGIDVQVEAVHPGPVITRFELQPAAGTKVSQISNLAKDLARSLSAISVRIVEVIPGKTTIGLEIPNEHRETVRLSEIISSKAFADSKSPLTLALGKDISGVASVADLAKMPHLLVAGTTGAGKSVALNAMVLSLLYNSTPSEVRMIMIDPKMLELSIYDGIPHLLAPVVIDMKEAANALRWCVAEMDMRYRLMSNLKVRNITGYNKKVNDAIKAKEPIKDPFHPKDSELPAADLQPLPYIVVVVDELADMMMVVGKKVEELIARLAQKARASGIHLVLATQRPSVDVLTGLIKSNIPTRIAFQVSSRVDSRTILDQMGAEQLLGHGDMLYLPPGTAIPTRIHGAFVDDHEVNNVVDSLKKSGKPQYIEEVTTGPKSENAMPGYNDDDEGDALYDDAVRIVTETRKASISGVQRRLKIGYNRAARMIEAMELAGIVGPAESNGSREVIAPPPPKD
ncbi:MAG: DNA translocase FtsK 4TM domain-containing protein [Gammaproteobacteria bacterium]|nr:DNA translocase FtsK 4TM domain-containing protein [Gammaproteobacteria bacterium]